MSHALPMPFASDPAQLLKTEYIDNLATSTWYDVRKQLFTDIWQITPFFDLLQEKGKIKQRMPNGRYFEIPIGYAKADQNQKWFTRGDTFGESEKELWTRLQYQRKNLGDSIVRYWDDEQKNKSKAQIFNYLTELLDNHKMTLMDTLGTAVWDASPAATAINSLPTLIVEDPTTGTVGGLDRSSNTYLRNQYYNMTSDSMASLLIPKMTTMFNNCSKLKGKGRRTPDIIITTQDIYEEYEDQIRNDFTFEISGNNGTKRADYGLGDLSFKGAELYWDPDCPAGSMYFLNSDTIEFAYDPDAWMEMTPWKTKHNSLDRYAQTYTVCQLLFNNFGKNGVIFNIGDTA